MDMKTLTRLYTKQMNNRFMKLIISIVLLLVHVAAFAQADCEKLDNMLKQYQITHHESLRIIRRIRDRVESVEHNIPVDLKDSFTWEETDMFYSCGRVPQASLMYDEYSRKRILQLLKNEFEEGELDFLVDMYSSYSARDGIYHGKYRFTGEEEYKNKFLRDRNSEAYKQLVDSCIEMCKPIQRERLLTTYCFSIKYIIKLAGVIESKEIVDQLLKMYDDPKCEEYKSRIYTALVRQKVEPFYSNFIKERKYDESKGYYDLLPNVNFRTRTSVVYYTYSQDAILDLLPYLDSDTFGILEAVSEESQFFNLPLKMDAFNIIKMHIMNTDLWAKLGVENPIKFSPPDDYLTPKRIKMIKKWIKSNYGKYQLRRVW